MLSQEDLETVTAQPANVRPSGISGALRAISRETPEIGTSGKSPALAIAPIRHTWDLEEVYRITHDGYAALGYIDPRPDGRLVHHPHLDGIPETTVLIALLDGQVVGTNSLTLDGPRGLHVDHDFKTECDAIRNEGRRLAGSWRIGTRSWLRSETRVVMALIRETLQRSLRQNVQTCVFTFAARHERIYQKLLNLRTVARMEGSATGLRNGPTVFMRLDAEDIPRRWLEEKEAS